MSQLKQLQHLVIHLQDIKNATQDFSERNYIGRGGYGRVYKGNLSRPNSKDSRPVAVKRLDVKGYQGKDEFYTEISLLAYYQHKNIVSLIGFCDDSEEMILVYEYMSRGSLDKYLSGPTKLYSLSWSKRLKICVDVARALDYLHNHVGEQYRIIHRDVKSANVLLDENWNAKISDFGLSKIGLANQPNTFLFTKVAGTQGYCDPQYQMTGVLTKESDVYSLGVVLFEILCGRLVYVPKYHDEQRFLLHLAQDHYENGNLEKIIDQRIRKQIVGKSLSKFSAIAYQCLQEQREDRPTTAQVVKELEEASRTQIENYLSSEKAASLIQKSFRLCLVKRSRTFQALIELHVAKSKLKEIQAFFQKNILDGRTTDTDAWKRSREELVELVQVVKAVEGAHYLVCAERKSVLDKLEKFLNSWKGKDEHFEAAERLRSYKEYQAWQHGSTMKSMK